MTHAPADEPLDDRLQQLLAVEQRLQQIVSTARQEAERRLTEARAASQARRDTAAAARAEAEAEQDRHDDEAHRQALAAIDTAHRNALQALSAIPESTIETLARRAVQRTLGAGGGGT